MIQIIGAGLAGLSAAIHLAERNIPCNLFSLQPSERAQSVLAEGGINAALDTMGEGDAPALHFADTMRGGGYLADENAVRDLTEAAPASSFAACSAPFPASAYPGITFSNAARTSVCCRAIFRSYSVLSRRRYAPPAIIPAPAKMSRNRTTMPIPAPIGFFIYCFPSVCDPAALPDLTSS